MSGKTGFGPQAPARRQACIAAILLAVLTASGCGLVPTRQPTRPASVYLLEPTGAEASAERSTTVACAILLVEPPQPAPGFLTSRMIYVRDAHRLEQFAWSRWADTPTAMLEPMIVTALETSDAFSAVIAPPAPVDHDLLLVTQNVRLLQRFTEGQSRIELSADVRLFQPRARRLLGSERLEIVEQTAQPTPVGGVDAAGRAVDRLLGRMVEFATTGAARVDDLCPGS